MQEDSGIATNLRTAIQQLGISLIQNEKVREVLNEKMVGLATNFSEQYSDKIIRYISERIHEWDSREMIAKIEKRSGWRFTYDPCEWCDCRRIYWFGTWRHSCNC